MQQFSEKKNATAAGCLIIAGMWMLLSGCTVAKNYKFSSKAVTNVSYNPKDCVEMVNGKFKCKDVVFTVATIEPIKSK
jgi:hypothetical protein